MTGLVAAGWLLEVMVLSFWSTDPSSTHWSRVALPVVAVLGALAATLLRRWAARAALVVAALACGMACLEIAFEVDGFLRAGWTLTDGLASNRSVAGHAVIAAATGAMVVAAVRLARSLRDA